MGKNTQMTRGILLFSPYPYASRVLSFHDYYLQRQDHAAQMTVTQAPSLRFQEKRVNAARKQSMFVLQMQQNDSIKRVRQSVSTRAGAVTFDRGNSRNGPGEMVASRGLASPSVSSDTSTTRRGTILDRIFSSSASSTQSPLASGPTSGRVRGVKGTVPSANKLLQLHSKSMSASWAAKTCSITIVICRCPTQQCRHIYKERSGQKF